MDPQHVQNEINVKLKICDIIERLLDMRQNYMIQNVLVFFKYYVLQGDHEENNEELMRRRLNLENKKSKTKKINYEDLSQMDKNKLIIERLMGLHQLGLLPNCAKTGIKEIDEPPKESSNDPFAALKLLKESPKGKDRFYSYIAELNLEQAPEIYDLDQYLSMGLDDPNPLESPVGSLLPTLLNSFAHIQDQSLEKRCIGLIMRLFNQKEEFKQNLQKLQVIFDDEKTLLYRFISKHMNEFKKLVDRSDIWFSNFQRSAAVQETNDCMFILNSLNIGLMKGLR